MLAIIGASGKIGGATLDALLENSLLPKYEIVACTSSKEGSETWDGLASKGVRVRHADFDDRASMIAALSGCEKLFLVSTPRIELDFNDARPGTGRERQHKTAIDAAREARVNHIYYISLAFGSSSAAGVMQAHLRTEAYLASLTDISSTILREGLYNESWPLYLGFYDIENDDRDTLPIAGDGKISWTAIADLGLASALVIAAPMEEYRGKTLYLSNSPDTALTMAQVADLIGRAKERHVETKVVTVAHYEKFYIEERKVDAPMVKWWSSTYPAVQGQECLIDDPTLARLLAARGRKPESMQDTIKEMISGSM